MAMSAKMATNVAPELLLAVWKEKNVMEKRKRRRKEKKESRLSILQPCSKGSHYIYAISHCRCASDNYLHDIFTWFVSD